MTFPHFSAFVDWLLTFTYLAIMINYSQADAFTFCWQLVEIWSTFSQVAVKIIDMNNIKDDYVRRNLFREARLLRRLSHPNIIKLFETIKVTF